MSRSVSLFTVRTAWIPIPVARPVNDRGRTEAILYTRGKAVVFLPGIDPSLFNLCG